MSIALIAVFAFGLAGCGDSDYTNTNAESDGAIMGGDDNNGTIFGTWSNVSYILTLNEGGGGQLRETNDDEYSMDIAWEIEGEILTIGVMFSEDDMMPYMSGTYSLEGDSLYITANDPSVAGLRWSFTRQ